MLRELRIENIAIIEKAAIQFGPGLNVLTGETGAGKSIIIDSIAAATGARVGRDLIRTGAERAIVTAVFDLNGAEDWLNENEIDCDDEVILQRRINSDGKSSCRVCGCPVTAGQLRQLGSLLLELHGQNDGLQLLDERRHLLARAFPDLHHHGRELPALVQRFHEGSASGLDVEHDAVVIRGEFLPHDARDNQRYAFNSCRNVAQRIQLFVGRRKFGILADDCKPVPVDDLDHFLDGNVRTESLDGFQLVDRTAGVFATLTPNVATRGATIRLVLSPTPPVECLSTRMPLMPSK